MSDKDKSGGISGFSVGFGKQGGSGGPREVSERGPLRIAVLAQLTPRADYATGATPHLDPIQVDKQSFDRVMEQLAPALAIDIADPFEPRDPLVRVDLRFREMKEMRPDAIAEQVPLLRALVSAKRIVEDVRARKTSAADARAQLGRILPRPSWAQLLTSEVMEAHATRPAPTAAATTEAAPAKSGGGGIDDLLSMVDIGAPPPASVRPTEAPEAAGEGTLGGLSAIVSAVARGARGERKHPRAVVGSAPEKVERAFTRVLSDILTHPEVRRIERAWRGLRLLLEHCDFRAGVEVDVVPVGPDRVEEALQHLAAVAQHESERAPIDLFVVDGEVGADAVDLDRLARWAELAEGFRAPIVTNGEPSVLGVDALDQVAKMLRRRTTRDDPRSVAVRGFAARDAARWVALALNGVLVRAPYTASTSRVRDIPFAEDPNDKEAHVFVGPAFVVGALCAKSYVRTGWPTQIVGPRDGQLGNLPVHEITDNGHAAAIPLETFIAADAQSELAREGFIVLSCAPNSDAAIVGKAPVAYRGPTAGARDDAPAESTLADQLFVGRFANAVEQLAAAVPADSDPHAAGEVARVMLAELFANAPPSGPEIEVRVDTAKRSLVVTVRPRRFAGISLEEVTLGAKLG